MAYIDTVAEEIPGFLSVCLIFNGELLSGQKTSIAWLKDNDKEALVALEPGLKTTDSNLTPRMKSYLTGLAEIGDYLKSRKTVDEDDVTEDDVERGAIILAFPRVAQNAAALTALKKHLDALQKHGVLEKLPSSSSAEQPQAENKGADSASAATPAATQLEPAPQKRGLFGGTAART